MPPTLDSYDQIPYDAVPITDTHPDHLHVLGKLFGLNPAPPERCRVLEFGSADGANIIPLAYYMPQCRCVGVELSQVQVDTGNALIRDLGLTNVELLHRDVMQLDRGFGEFDYIIAHGIYSWVPPPVQDKILELCGSLLAPHGVAYISYNVLPGWRGRAMVRDMLLHHCRNITSPRERLHAAEQLLDQLAAGWNDLDAPVLHWLQQEVAQLKEVSRSYLFHEYLEEFNAPVLFSEFARRAENHGLRYLCDSDLHTMFPSTLGATAAKLLESFDDLIEQEQYSDFLRARPFRRSLLCRADRELSRDISLAFLNDYGLVAHLTPLETPDPDTVREQTYVSASGKKYDVSQPAAKRALHQLAAAFPNPLPLAELVHEPAHRAALVGELFNLFGVRALQLTPRTNVVPGQISARPRAHRLALAQAARGHVSSARHIDIDLDPPAVYLLSQLDGTRTRAELEQLLNAHVGTSINVNVAANIDRLLALFARHGLLEA